MFYLVKLLVKVYLLLFQEFDKEQFKRVPVIVRGKSTATKLKRDEMRQLKKEISERNVELHKVSIVKGMEL